MKIGEFRFYTDQRGLAATLVTLGVPFKSHVPITNEYSPDLPKPGVPVGSPGWRPGKVHWYHESASETWESLGRPVTPKDITKAFFDGRAAMAFPEQIKAVNDAFASKDINKAQAEWNKLRDALPFVLAGYMATLVKNYLLIWLPMLKKAWTQITIPNGDGHIHMSTNPSETVKKAFL